MAINIEELRNLPPDKKLQLVTMLWDDLRESGGVPELPQPNGMRSSAEIKI